MDTFDRITFSIMTNYDKIVMTKSALPCELTRIHGPGVTRKPTWYVLAIKAYASLDHPLADVCLTVHKVWGETSELWKALSGHVTAYFVLMEVKHTKNKKRVNVDCAISILPPSEGPLTVAVETIDPGRRQLAGTRRGSHSNHWTILTRNRRQQQQ